MPRPLSPLTAPRRVSSGGERRRQRLAVVVVPIIAAASMAACSSGAPSSGSAVHRVSASTPLVSFEQAEALAADGVIPAGTAIGTCGSSQYGWLSEVEHVGLSKAKVTRHWAAFVPTGDGLAAKQMEASGTIADSDLGANDVPFDHPFGGDLSFDEELATPFAKLDQNVGPLAARGQGNPRQTIHDELMTGLLPHSSSSASRPSGSSWPVFAQQSESGISPGFTPAKGDAVAVRGSWVADCGHEDFHSELHSVSFMTFASAEGTGVTVAHAFANPYEVAQVFDPNFLLDGDMALTPAERAAAGQNLLEYIVTAILRVAEGKDRTATLPMMLEPNTGSPTPWVVCAPPGSSGSSLQVSYAFTARPGVSIAVQPNAATGCAVVSTEIGAGYAPENPPGLSTCPTSWAWLSANAFSDSMTASYGGKGNSTGNIEQDILNELKSISPALARSLAPTLDRGLVSLCYPPLTIPTLPSPASGVHSVATSATQAVPFAGWVRVSWN